MTIGKTHPCLLFTWNADLTGLSDLSMLADAAMEYMNNETHNRTADTKTEKQDEPPPLGKYSI